uniref:VP2 n=1 Tax=Bat calicivirus TaxID=1514705 RepID=A0A0D3MCR9_9CALI|nr:VP2 [Bat calicivirus]
MAAMAGAQVIGSLAGAAVNLGSSLGTAKINADAQKEINRQNLETSIYMQKQDQAFTKDLNLMNLDYQRSVLVSAGFDPSDAALISSGARSMARKTWTPSGYKLLGGQGTGWFHQSGQTQMTDLGRGAVRLGFEAKRWADNRKGSYDVSRVPSSLSNPTWGQPLSGQNWGSLAPTPPVHSDIFVRLLGWVPPRSTQTELTKLMGYPGQLQARQSSW